MFDRRFFAITIISFCFVLSLGFIYIYFFDQQGWSCLEKQRTTSSTYQEIDLDIPIQEFLKRGANSANLSMVKRALVNQWIYFNQQNVIKLTMSVQGARSFEEMKKAFLAEIKREQGKNSASSFITGMLDAISKDQKLIHHVNQSLQEGLTPKIHELRGQIMQAEKDSKEYKKLKNEYRKVFYEWIDKKHGSLLDSLILQF